MQLQPTESAPSLVVFLAETYGVPLIAAGILLGLRMLAELGDLGLEDCIDVAMDWAVLGVGACGAIFDNPYVKDSFGEAYGIVTVMTPLAVVLILVMMALLKQRQPTPVSERRAFVSLFLGALGLWITVLPVIWAYNHR